MKTSVFGLCILGLAALSGSAQAQCGCRSGYNSVPMSYSAPKTYSAPMSHSAPMSYSAPMSNPASVTRTIATAISYVNKLDTPMDRGTYSLLYAVHMSNGQVLYTDYLPSGFTARGTEAFRSGRKAKIDMGTDGKLTINDASSQQAIAILPR